MATNEQILRAYLAKLGWKIDEEGFRKFKDRMDETSKRFKEMSRGMEQFMGYATTAATVVGTAVLKISSNLRDLYFSAQRSSTGAANLLSFQRAAEAIGISSEEASSAILGMAKAMRAPGMAGLFQQITGTAPGKDAIENIFRLVDAMNKLKLPFYQRKQWAETFGISEDMLYLMEQNRAELGRLYTEQKKHTDQLDAQAKASAEFEKRLSLLRARWQELERSLIGWLPTGDKILDVLTSFADELLKLDKATEGWSTRIGTLVGALTGLFAGRWAVGKGLQWLARMFGIRIAGGEVAAAATGGAGLGAATTAGVGLGIWGSWAAGKETFKEFWREYHRSPEEQKKLHERRMELMKQYGMLPATGGVTLYPRQTVKDVIDKYAQMFGIDPKLAEAQAWQESRWKQSARSRKGAIGVMQLMPETAASLHVDPYSLEGNIQGGLLYLRDLLRQFGGDISKALAAYDAGPGAVRKYGGVPPFQETQDYVAAILGRYRLGTEIGPSAGIKISQDTKITVNGVTEPHAVANQVTREQDRVNGDLIRNMAGAVR